MIHHIVVASISKQSKTEAETKVKPKDLQGTSSFPFSSAEASQQIQWLLIAHIKMQFRTHPRKLTKLSLYQEPWANGRKLSALAIKTNDFVDVWWYPDHQISR